ncbi:ATP-dependent zinc metalloprotease FtsH [compost metagenome]
MTIPEEDRVLTSRAQLIDRITMMLGGQVAESLIFNEITTGASNDLERATDLARRMVTEWGMSEALGPLTFGKRQAHVFLGRDFGEDRNYSDAVASMIDTEVRRIVEDCYARARDILTTHKDKLVAISLELIKRETMDADEFDKIFTGPDPVYA